MRDRRAAWRVVRPIAFIAVYVLAAWLTDGLNLENGFSPWYPPAGFALAYLVVVGPRGAVTVVLARLAMVALTNSAAYDVEPDGVVIRALAITACYAAAAWLLRRLGLRRARLPELGWFAAVGVVGAPLGAAVVVAVTEILVLDASREAAFDAAWTFWIGDAVAIATIVPTVLMLVAAYRGEVRAPRLPASPAARFEAALQGLALVVAPVIALSLADQDSGTGFLALAIIPAIWVAVRADLVLAAVGFLLLNVSLSTVASVSLGASSDLSELQAVMLAAALAGLYVAASTHTQQMAEADLIDSEQRYRSLLDAAPDLVVRFEANGDCHAANHPAWLPREGVQPVLDALRWSWQGAGRAVLNDAEPRTVELTVRALDGDQHLLCRLGAEHSADGAVRSVVAVVSDLTAQRQAMALLDHERRHDALTGLSNRTRFLHELESLTEASSDVVLAVADVDGFGAVNDMFGTKRGDAVLCEVAERLLRVAGPAALVGRLGADQFAVAVHADETTATAVGSDLLRAMRVRVVEADRTVFLTGSVGLALTSGRDITGLLSDADTAMHAAKESGRDRFVLLDDERRAATLDRRGMLSHLRACLDAGDIVVHHQPVIDLTSGEVQGFEALVRLPAPDGEGLIFPGSFLPLAEETELDVRLGELVLDRALADIAWLRRERHTGPIVINVNVTARQLTLPGFVHVVLAACRKHGVDPSCVRLELTETLVLADPEAAVTALRQLRAMGISSALDDFGVGYSSMIHLQRLPVDVLKIDRAFVGGLPDDSDDRAIVGLVLGLAEALDLSVTAEGIETEEQRRCLIELGCGTGQGYLLGRPAPIADAVLTPRPLHPS